MFGTTIRDLVVVPLGTYVGSKTGSLEESTDGSVDGKFDGLLDQWMELRSENEGAELIFINGELYMMV